MSLGSGLWVPVSLTELFENFTDAGGRQIGKAEYWSWCAGEL